MTTTPPRLDFSVTSIIDTCNPSIFPSPLSKAHLCFTCKGGACKRRRWHWRLRRRYRRRRRRRQNPATK